MTLQNATLIWSSKIDPYDKLVLLALNECSGSDGEYSYWREDVEALGKFIGTSPGMLKLFAIDRFKRAGILTKNGVPRWLEGDWRIDLDLILDYDPYARNTDEEPLPPKPKRKIHQGYVYLLEAEGGEYYKIGKARNPHKRTETLAIQLPFPVKLEHIIECDDYDLAERRLHEIYHQARTNGEWFALTPDEVEEIRAIDEFSEGEFG
jgi:hypothetical protein